jgi:diguanylate cyclase (GGDEF)-like protein
MRSPHGLRLASRRVWVYAAVLTTALAVSCVFLPAEIAHGKPAAAAFADILVVLLIAAAVAEGAVRAARDALEARPAQSATEGLAATERRVLEMIASSTPLEEVLNELARLIESQSPGTAVMLVLIAPDGLHVRLGAAPSLPAGFVRELGRFVIGPENCSCGAAMSRAEPAIVSDIATSPLWREFGPLALEHGLRACWSTPIFSRTGAVLGSFAMYYREVHSPLDSERGLVELATHIAGIAIEHARTEDRVQHMARYDALTDFPNRVLFREKMAQVTGRGSGESHTGVLLIDLDGFKDVNDTLGHEVGDQLLCEAAARLRSCARPGDTVARLGGDEFAMSLPGLREDSEAAGVAEKVLQALRAPFTIDIYELHTTASIGICLHPRDGSSPEALVRNADAALYHAKDSGRDRFEFFRPALNEAAQQRMETARRLRNGLQREEFELHYQPQVELRTGRICVIEALLRWRQEDGAVISAGPYIPVAEQSGLIVPIGDWVLRTACEQLGRWHREGLRDLRVAINVSARQFRRPDFHRVLSEAIRAAGIPAGAVELEITESLLLPHDAEAAMAFERAASLGVRLVVDDFGTGYSNLIYLQRFPVQALKIDQSFMRQVGVDANTKQIVSTLIAMAGSLRLDVIAEGVESAQQVEFLRAQGCDFAQGFFYTAALPPAELIRFLLEAATTRALDPRTAARDRV